MTIQVIVRLPVLGTHFWPGAPPKRAYLRSEHPHRFTFVAARQVHSADREIELHDLREDLSRAVRCLGHLDADTGQIHFGGRSCEMLAREVLERLSATEVEVWEDEDCGARVSA